MRIGACWIKEKNGTKYFSCQLDCVPVEFIQDKNFAIFRNTKKTKPNQPDYLIAWSEQKKPSGNTGQSRNYNDDIPI